MSIHSDFLSAVKAAMAKQSISQGELASRIGASQPYVAKILSGAQNPSLAVAEKFSSALGIKVRFSAGKVGAKKSS